MAEDTQLEKLKIVTAGRGDINILVDIAHGMRSEKDPDYFDMSFDLQKQGERTVLIAYLDGAPCGYCMLSWNPKYGFYRRLDIPEVQDLNVLPAYRRRGIGRSIIEHCEVMAKKRKFSHIGIGVGLDASYGAAQRLYMKMGYVPDGNGVTYDRVNVRHGEMRPVDDDLSLMLVKEL